MNLRHIEEDRFLRILLEEQNQWKRIPALLTADAQGSPGHQRQLMRILPHLMVEGTPNLHHLLKGPRRSGKSTLMWQTLQALRDRYGISPEQMFYFQMDHPELSRESLGAIVDAIEEISPQTSHDNPMFLFIDEIGVAQNWRGWLKMYSDSRRPLRILASSSAFAYAQEGDSLDSGIDRWQEHQVMPCNFMEFLEMLARDAKVLPEWCWPRFASLKERLASIPRNAQPDQKMQESLMKMALLGGYPRCIKDFNYERSGTDDEATNVHKAHNYLSEIVDKVTHQDIPLAQRVKDPHRMIRLIQACSRNMARQTSISKVGKAAGIDNAATTLKYMVSIEDSHIAFRLHPYVPIPENHETLPEGTARKPTNQKLVFCDTAMAAAIRQAGIFSVIDDNQRGWGYENMAGAALNELATREGRNLNYWRLEERYEVDFLYDAAGEGILAVEIGSSPDHHKRNLQRIINEIPRLRNSCYMVAPTNLVIHPDDTRDGIGQMPLAFFLLAVNAQSLQSSLTVGGRVGGTNYRVEGTRRDLLERPTFLQPDLNEDDMIFLTDNEVSRMGRIRPEAEPEQ